MVIFRVRTQLLVDWEVLVAVVVELNHPNQAMAILEVVEDISKVSFLVTEEVTPNSSTQPKQPSTVHCRVSLVEEEEEEEVPTEVVLQQDARANSVGEGSRGSLEIQCDLKKPWCYCMI
ncbi:hypothetical protein D9C73_015175 [Collichthys lucidus]|uniref:Uncharacterized protein n=1 Tax=Collichthys lucidus TaxID=240159 RepID=A0A4U5V1Q4_COLLU|nr:hypothetical protein D9C73_015175 [Collichthys lucidus]